MMMILADSCCDLSPELLKKTQARVAPLTITIDDTHYVDDGTVDIPPYLAAMKASKNPVRSACPSPDLYAEDIKAADDDCFIITLSSKLSGSHNAAVLGVQPVSYTHLDVYKRQTRVRAISTSMSAARST